MKFLHLADLHIGKSVNAFSMLEDQEYVLEQVLGYVRAHRPQAVLIAGDVYDKTLPGPEAVRVFDRFLTALAGGADDGSERGAGAGDGGERGAGAEGDGDGSGRGAGAGADGGGNYEPPAVIVISGNHDSPERLGFASRILQDRNVYLYGLFDGQMRRVTCADEYGAVRFYLLPFIRPSAVRRFYAETADAIENSSDAVRVVIEAMGIDPAGIDAAENGNIYKGTRNVLVAHQFFCAGGDDPERSDSERELTGGLDSVDVFTSGIADRFDYAALGHLHGPQRVGAEHIRYAGSPLKYSFSECSHRKAALLVELRAKGELTVTPLPLTPLRDMRRVKGPLAALLSRDVSAAGNTRDYLHVTLTDEDEIIDALGKLRTVYPNVMELSFENARTQADPDLGGAADPGGATPLALFEDFFAAQNGAPMRDKQKNTVRALLEPDADAEADESPDAEAGGDENAAADRAEPPEGSAS
ncbi:MAG: exonuclease SbcCD subunit D [Clostridiales bacterium]|nr:exonuclease SbcCD subunit D [Clostridiales bacterium]